MNRVDAEELISSAVGYWSAERVPARKRPPNIKNSTKEFDGVKTENKVRRDFAVPYNIETNVVQLPELDKKFSRGYEMPVRMRNFLPQEKKISDRARYKAGTQEEKNDFKDLIKIKKPENFIREVCDRFGGGNITGKLFILLHRRVEKLPTPEEEAVILSEKERIVREKREAERRRAAELAERERIKRLKYTYCLGVRAFTAATVFFAVITLIAVLSSGNILFGEDSGNMFIGLTAATAIMFLIACLFALCARRTGGQTVLSPFSIVSLAILGVAVGTFYPAYTSGKLVLWIIPCCAGLFFWLMAETVLAKRFGLKDKRLFVELGMVVFCVALCSLLGTKAFPADRYEGHDGNFYYYDVGDGTAAVVASKFDDTVIYPREIDGKTVTVIVVNKNTAGKSKLRSVAIPETVVSISDNAFSDCKNLSDVTAPVHLIKDFDGSALQYVTLYGEDIPANLFDKTNILNRNVKLKSIYFVDAVNIGARAFLSCTDLELICFSDSIQTVGELAFANCTALEKTEIPDSVNSIGAAAFMRCTGLRSVVLPREVTLGSGVFRECNNIIHCTVPAEHISQIPQDSLVHAEINGGEEIPERAFFACRSLQIVTVGDSVKTIGERAFQGCNKLDTVRLHDGITQMGKYAFAGCNALTEFTIPAGVTEISGWLFEWCRGLKKVTMPGTVRICEAAFWGCESLELERLPETEEIAYGAFAHCKSLKSVDLPLSLVSVGDMAFAYCDNLTRVWISHGVKSIGEKAFLSCGSLSYVAYNGTEEDFENLRIGKDNDSFINAERKYLHEYNN